MLKFRDLGAEEIERLEKALENAEQEIKSLKNGSYDEIRK